MAHKQFHFDFDEDAEPVEELHRFRAAVSEHFKTIKAMREYIHSAAAGEEFPAGPDARENAKKAAQKTPKRRKVQPAKTQRTHRKPAQSPVHA